MQDKFLELKKSLKMSGWNIFHTDKAITFTLEAFVILYIKNHDILHFMNEFNEYSITHSQLKYIMEYIELYRKLLGDKREI